LDTAAGFLDKIDHAVAFVHLDNPKPAGLVHRHADRADGGVGLLLTVKLYEHVVVHLVDMVAGQDQHAVRAAMPHEVEILHHRVAIPSIPVGVVAPLIRLENLDASGECAIQVPGATFPDVIDQAVRTILGEDQHVEYAGVDAVAQGKIDDPVFAGEGYGRLGAFGGQRGQPCPRAAS
jgi:hypothetical protein